MTDALRELSAFSVFLGISAIGFLFLLISLIFGEVFDHLGADVDHDIDHGGPTFLSPRIMSVFITAFGGFGAVASHYGMSTVASSGVGFVSGFVFASIILAFARFLYGQQATTELSSSDLIGRTARVVVKIPADGVGQVRCQVGADAIDKLARSADGTAIAENAVVRIEEVLDEVVNVKPV